MLAREFKAYIACPEGKYLLLAWSSFLPSGPAQQLSAVTVDQMHVVKCRNTLNCCQV